jgi:hypothetical protein
VLFGNPKHSVHTKGPISFHVAMSRSILMLAEMVVKILFREEKKAVLSTLIVPSQCSFSFGGFPRHQGMWSCISFLTESKVFQHPEHVA